MKHILKKICDHPLLLSKRAAEDVLEGMESILTQEEAGMVERLAMHIADDVDTDDFQTKNDIISCKLSFIMSLLENLIPEGHRVLIFSQTRKMLNLIQIFDMFDKRKGVVHFGDFVRSLYVFHPNVSLEDKIDCKLTLYDMDCTGFIKRQEVKQMLIAFL
ncbi:unnamed protein product [Thlaspi arvense]|uniref:EF-hand domain-containing protein n=1 Tax=Thlaspi arvense TaxID=13288 RepID=A0AAU9T948_THLAR|nr:unnamed protein product [Thlaspi arvense]